MIIDVVCLIFAGYGFWVGYSKGIISTVLNLSSYFFGILAAMKFGPVMGDMIAGAMPGAGSSVSFLAGVVITFIIVLILFRLLARGLTGALESVNINFINQILGGVLSAIFFSLIFSACVICPMLVAGMWTSFLLEPGMRVPPMSSACFSAARRFSSSSACSSRYRR